MNTKLLQLAECAEAAARNAALEIMKFHKKGFVINEKGPANLVTEADLAAEKIIVETIKSFFPNHKFLGEELEKADLNSAELWVIDPIDGTANFAHGIPHIGISIAYCEFGIPKVGVVYQPFSDEMFLAIEGQGASLNGKSIKASTAKTISESVIVTGFHHDFGPHITQGLKAAEILIQNKCHGIRRFGAASLDLCFVACGRFDGYYEFKLSPWDFAAGMLIVREAGGMVENTEGKALSLNDFKVIATNKHILPELMKVINLAGVSI